MITNTEFEYLNWVNKRLETNINPNKIKSALMFSVLWNMFEHEVCDDKFNLEKVKEKVEQYKIELSYFEDELNYFKVRRKNYSGDNYIENGLRGTESQKRTIANLLDDNITDKIERVLALVLIIFRLRNNMFHGPKEVRDLEYQEPNFKTANSILKKFLNFIKPVK